MKKQTILSDQIENKNIKDLKEILGKEVPGVNFIESLTNTNKNSLIAKFKSASFTDSNDNKVFFNGFDIQIEDGVVKVLTSPLSDEQIKALVNIFNLMGISEFTFAFDTDKEFGDNFQNAYNEEVLGGFQTPALYESKVDGKAREGKGISIQKAEKSLIDSVTKLGNRLYDNVKIKYGLNGSFSIKIYPDKDAMETSGLVEVDKEGNVKRNPQKWEFSIQFKPKVVNGINSLEINYATKGRAPITDDQAKEYIVTPFKDAGYSHMYLGSNIGNDKDNGALLKACAQKQVIPILPVEKFIFYKIFLNTIKEEGGKMTNADRLKLLEGTYQQMIESNNGSEDFKGEMIESVNLLKELLVETKENQETSKTKSYSLKVREVIIGLKKTDENGKANPDLQPLERYDAWAIKEISEAISKLNISSDKIIDLKKELRQNIIDTASTETGVEEGLRDLSKDIIKSSVDWREKLEYLPKYEYSASNAKEVLKTINDAPHLSKDEKQTFRETLLSHIKLSHYTSSGKTDIFTEPKKDEIARVAKSVRVQIDMYEHYDKNFQSKIEAAIATDDTKEIYATVIATTKVLDNYKKHIEDPSKNREVDFNKEFKIYLNSAKKNFDKSLDGLYARMATQKAETLVANASKILRAGKDRYKKLYDADLLTPDIPSGNYKAPPAPAKPPKSKGGYRTP